MTNNTKVTDSYPIYQKLDSNCPDAEKSGSGPGSCSGGAKDTSQKPVRVDKLSNTLHRYVGEKGRQAYVQAQSRSVTYNGHWKSNHDTIEEAHAAAKKYAETGEKPSLLQPVNHVYVPERKRANGGE